MLVSEIRVRALGSLIPPPRLTLSTWIEHELRLPEGVSALPGPVRLWPYQREIADAISDPEIERVTLIKPVRVGFRPFRFHDLRHLHAITWLKSGRSIYELQHRLGHASIKTTEGYLEAGYLAYDEIERAKAKPTVAQLGAQAALGARDAFRISRWLLSLLRHRRKGQAGLANRRLQPLGHLSGVGSPYSRRNTTILRALNARRCAANCALRP
jgi:hypothetical protein